MLGTPAQVQAYIDRTFLFQFDLDGTLVLTDSIYFQVWKELLLPYEIHLTHSLFKDYIQGYDDMTALNHWIPHVNTFIKKDISKRKDELFLQHMDELILIDGSLSFLQNIYERGHKITIVTNCNRNIAEKICQHCGFDAYIDHLIIGSECTHPKPYPDPYLQGCQCLAISNDKCFIFEDSKIGLQSAKAVHPKCIIGLQTHFNASQLKDMDIEWNISNYNDLRIEDLYFHEEVDRSFQLLKQCILHSLSEYPIQKIEIPSEKLKGGYISEIVAVTLYTPSQKLECVLKMENSKETHLSQMAKTLGLYEREYYFYEYISKDIKIPIPAFYGLVKNEDHQTFGLLLENIKTPNTELNLNLNQESIDVTLSILKSLAQLHSQFWNQDLQRFYPQLPKNNDPLFYPTWSHYLEQHWPSFQEQWKHYLTSHHLFLGASIVSHFSKIQAYLSQGHLTLCHGDVKSPNIFYRSYGGDFIQPFFIDWQYITHGKGAQDLVFLLIESFHYSCPVWKQSLFKSYYYQQLIEHKVQHYSWEEYHKDFIHSICYYPFFVAVWFGITPPKDLIDIHFPSIFIQKLFSFMDTHVPLDYFNDLYNH